MLFRCKCVYISLSLSPPPSLCVCMCAVTKEIARYVHQVINLPADVTAALAQLDKLELDVLLFPDWQPFPDQQSIFFQSIRIAPVQVRSVCCATAADTSSTVVCFSIICEKALVLTCSPLHHIYHIYPV